MALYAVERFVIEFVRAKEDRFLLGLTTSQGMSILLLIAAAVVWVRQSKKPVWEPKNAPASAKPAVKVKQARSPA
jgi:prolipoprotein diacylglyceryltransferase